MNTTRRQPSFRRFPPPPPDLGIIVVFLISPLFRRKNRFSATNHETPRPTSEGSYFAFRPPAYSPSKQFACLLVRDQLYTVGGAVIMRLETVRGESPPLRFLETPFYSRGLKWGKCQPHPLLSYLTRDRAALSFVFAVLPQPGTPPGEGPSPLLHARSFRFWIF